MLSFDIFHRRYFRDITPLFIFAYAMPR